MERERWANRSTFILAAIGSAVGMGNAWRFPAQVYKNGGGAFLIPYIVAIVTAGIPFLALEISLGKKYQGSAPVALGKINKKFEWIGWVGVASAFFISIYYVGAVMSWIINYIGASFTMAWTKADSTAAYFTSDILHLTDSPGILGGLPINILIGTVIAWVCVWWCIRKGVHSVGAVVKYTVLLPVILLAILLVRGLTLPGAMEGIKYYLSPDFSKLLSPSVWIAAYGQVFFSLSVLFAIMFAYGSFLPKESNVTKDSIIIAACDMFISFLAGFAVFTVLGYLSNQTGTAISDMSYAGPMLTFATYPQALALMPGGHIGQVIFSVLFFFMLFTLAIDSGFSIVEAVSVAISDKFGLDRGKTTLYTCIVAAVCSLLFATGAGLYWLDIVDHFVNDFMLILTGVLECIAIGWIIGASKIREEAVNVPGSLQYGRWWDYTIRFVCPIIFLWMALSFLYVNITTRYEGYDQVYLIMGGWLIVAISFVFGLVMPRVGKDVTKI